MFSLVCLNYVSPYTPTFTASAGGVEPANTKYIQLYLKCTKNTNFMSRFLKFEDIFCCNVSVIINPKIQCLNVNYHMIIMLN